MAHRAITAGELRLEPVTVEQARAIITDDLGDLPAGDGWPTEDTVAGMTMVSLGRVEAWLVTLGGTVIGDVGASVAGDTAEFAYTLAEPYRGMGFEQAIGLALPPELAARPGVVAVRDGSRAAVDRRPPRIAAGERDTLLAFLGYLRESLIGKLDGLSEEEARRSLVPSGTNLLGLVKHVAQAEHSWVLYSWAGGDDADLPDEAPRPGDTIEGVAATARGVGERVEEAVRGCDDLTRPVAHAFGPRRGLTLRWILVHLIEEVGRHAGHADILREQIDGRTGR